MRILVSLASVGILLALLHLAAGVVTPFLLGATLAVAFQPITRELHRRGMPPVISAVVTIAIVLAVVAGAAMLIYVATTDLAARLPEYEQKIDALKVELAGYFDSRDMHGAAQSVRRFDVDDNISSLATSGLFRAGEFLQGLFFVLVITAFIQLEAAIYRRKLIRALGSARKVHWLDGGLKELQRYLAIKMLVSLANGVFLGAWCAIWGIDSWLLWGVLAFALNFIPVIGSILASIPPILLGFVDGGVPLALAVASGYVLVNLVVDNILEPRILGRSLGLSPLVILLSMLVWGFVLGPVGAILSVPLTMVVKIAMERDPDLKPIALMMGDGSDLPEPPTPSGEPARKPATATP